jgi:hypothetical protein
MARHRVAYRGDGLQMWKVAANIMKNQLWRANKGWSSSLDVERGVMQRSRQRKTDLSFGTSNVRGLCRAGSQETVESTLAKCNFDVLAVQEVRWGEVGSQKVRCRLDSSGLG